jgi:hypothetical protein
MLQPHNAWTDETFRTALTNDLRDRRRPHRLEILDNGKHDLRDLLVLTVLTEIGDSEDPSDVTKQLQEGLDVIGAEGGRRGFVSMPGRHIYRSSLSETFANEFQDRGDNLGFLGKDWIFPS